MNTQNEFEQYVIPTYGRFPTEIVRGKGSWLWDSSGRRYLDFCAGIAVTSLGHSNMAIRRTMIRQSRKFLHCSNLYLIQEQSKLARKLVEKVIQIPGKCFFCNSGTEANEALIKLSRIFKNQKLGEKETGEIISFKKSFHGRTFAGISATGQDKIQKGFFPLLPGFKHLEFNNTEELKAHVSSKTVAIMLEIIQGEGGINIASKNFLNTINKICQENNILLFVDDIQAGIGRTGEYCSWQGIEGLNFTPDAVSWAKGLGGGIPIGAIWVRDKYSDLLSPGTHGCTFGGNPLSCAVANTVLDEIEKKKLLENVKKQGEYLKNQILALNKEFILGVQGRGLMLGIKINSDAIKSDKPALEIVKKLMKHQVLTVPAGVDVVRLLPALNIGDSEVSTFIRILKEID